MLLTVRGTYGRTRSAAATARASSAPPLAATGSASEFRAGAATPITRFAARLLINRAERERDSVLTAQGEYSVDKQPKMKTRLADGFAGRERLGSRDLR
jgi:hypothetical protein